MSTCLNHCPYVEEAPSQPATAHSRISNLVRDDAIYARSEQLYNQKT